MNAWRSFSVLSLFLLLLSLMLVIIPHAAAQQETLLFSFGPTEGTTGPKSPVIFDAHGILYGTGTGGNGGANGAVYQLKPKSGGTWALTILHAFGGTGDGIAPISGLVMDAAGNLYGTTSTGGAHNYGTVFELKHTSNGWVENVLHSFNADGKDGVYPNGSLILDSSGNLYGTTKAGGANFCIAFSANCGTVFELFHQANGGWGEKILHNFAQVGNTDGYAPLGNLIFDKSGNLYGTTSFGGSGFEGTVFELVHRTNGAWAEKILYNFGFLPDGANPAGGLVFDTAGNLYGITPSGGSQPFAFGTVFVLSPASGGTWTKTTIYNFGATNDGAFPQGTLVIDKSGNLYGATQSGGTDNAGALFEMSPLGGGAWSESILYSFTGLPGNYPNGANPYAGVILDASGNLYGTTFMGGAFDSGSVFELTP